MDQDLKDRPPITKPRKDSNPTRRRSFPLSISLPLEEGLALHRLAQRRKMSKTAIVRQAIRLLLEKDARSTGEDPQDVIASHLRDIDPHPLADRVGMLTVGFTTVDPERDRDLAQVLKAAVAQAFRNAAIKISVAKSSPKAAGRIATSSTMFQSPARLMVLRS